MLSIALVDSKGLRLKWIAILKIMTKIKDVLVKTQELISNPDKWCKREMIDGDGRLCLLGAIREAADDMEWEVKNFIRNTADIPVLFIFNDRSSTTHADVLKVLDECISKCET